MTNPARFDSGSAPRRAPPGLVHRAIQRKRQGSVAHSAPAKSTPTRGPADTSASRTGSSVSPAA